MCHWNNLGPLRCCVTISSYYTSKVSSLTLCEEYSLSSMRNRSLDLATLSGVLPSLSTDLRLVPVRETVYYIYMTFPVETTSLNYRSQKASNTVLLFRWWTEKNKYSWNREQFKKLSKSQLAYVIFPTKRNCIIVEPITLHLSTSFFF